MKNYLVRKNKAQSTIEFSMAFILAVLFLFLSANLFVWFNRNIVQRQKAYELSRVMSANSPENTVYSPGSHVKVKGEPGYLDFYNTRNTPGHPKNPNYKPLNVFAPGGYNK